MCEHSTLQYQWMRYLPSQDDGHAWEPIWTSVITNISTSIQNTPVLRPASEGPLRRIQEMRTHATDCLDGNGEPLFSDILPEVYLSQKYSYSDLSTLEKHGLRVINWSLLLKRIKVDLNASTSRMKTYTDEDWHRRVAQLLQEPIQKGSPSARGLRQMPFLPLRTGKWHTIADGAAYYQNVEGLTIPDGVPLNVVDASAASHPERRQLFDLLGVQTASIDLVRKLLKEKYRQRVQSLTLNQSIEDLHFMYMTHDCASERAEPLDVVIVTSDSNVARPVTQDVYMPSAEPLSPAQLLAPDSGPDDQTMRPEIVLLHQDYFASPPSKPTPSSPTWIHWLYDTINIRRQLRLKARNSNDISSECLYVAKHRPQKFMSLLNLLWRLQGTDLKDNVALKRELRKTEVLCRNDHTRALQDTCLPTQHFMDIASRFSLGTDEFPWLEIDGKSEGIVNPNDWKQLAEHLDLYHPIRTPDYDLAEWILKTIQEQKIDQGVPSDALYSDSDGFFGSERHLKMHNLYTFLEAQIRMSKDSEKLQNHLK